MTCFFCRGNAEQTTTEYIEKIDNFVVVIKNVPCEKCIDNNKIPNQKRT